MHSFKSLSAFAIGVLACLTTANILTILLSPWPFRETLHDARHYTYVGDDFPEGLPLPPAIPVAMVVENPARYSISGLDAREEWAANSPKGYSFVRLGPEHRPYQLSMFHQLHCLRVMRGVLAGDRRPTTPEHYSHCLVYLRQLILCNPDLTLEPADVMQHDYDVKQDGSVHVCHDWRPVYDAMADNWKEWQVVRQKGFHLNADGAVDTYKHPRIRSQ
ncbi:hypothetical protein BV20DRAFT_965212 [Pilatotrama ljubarskyi]|nr:hypothetical protein BV20DRAFT_965212 [Pilatotrama ljubarskyi]